MASLRPTFIQLRGRCQTSAPQWQQLRYMLQGLQISPKARHTRPLSTIPPDIDEFISKDDFAADSGASDEAERRAMLNRMIASLTVEPRERDSGRGQTDGLVRRVIDEDQGQEGQGDNGGPGPQFSEEPREPRGRRRSAPKWTPPAHVRGIPASPSYFSRKPEFNDAYLMLQKLMRKYAHLPTAPSDQLEKVAFRSRKDYRLVVGEDIQAAEYAKCITLVKRLFRIHPHLKPPPVKDAISSFLREINPHNIKIKDIPVDKFGRTLGVGRRKTSTARAWVVEGVGEVLVNGKSLADAFGRVHDRESAVWALKATARTDKYNVWALVEGGGTTGQAEALAMAVGKALLAHEPALKPALRRAGVVTRDPRGVERKKQGHLKARKKPAWVKR